MRDATKQNKVTILGIKNGAVHPVFNISGNCFDMAFYVDCIRRMYDSSDIDYLVIEPYRIKQLDIF